MILFKVIVTRERERERNGVRDVDASVFKALSHTSTISRAAFVIIFRLVRVVV